MFDCARILAMGRRLSVATWGGRWAGGATGPPLDPGCGIARAWLGAVACAWDSNEGIGADGVGLVGARRTA